MNRTTSLWRRLLILPPILAGVALLALAVANRPGPQQAEPEEAAVAARVVVVEPVEYVPQARGYGVVRPRASWQAVAQVRGPILSMHDSLRRGRLLEAGTEILRIDPADHELAVAQAEASLASAAARLGELETREGNLRETIATERRALELAERHLERQRTLRERQSVSETVVEQAEQGYIAASQRLQELENQLRLVPAQRRVLEAEMAAAEAQRAEADLSLSRTVIRLPFDARIDRVDVETGEFVGVGQVLVRAESIDEAEIEARIPLDHVKRLIPREVEVAALSDLPAAAIDALPQTFGLSAEIRLRLGEELVAWPADIGRVTFALDPQTQTAGVIATVTDPLRLARPGERPPLVKDMFVEVALRGRPRSAALVLPRHAVHRQADGREVVYVVGPDDRLAVREVAVAVTQGDLAVIEGGLDAGDRAVISDLAPAIEGMRLDPVRDQGAESWLRDLARGDVR